MTRRMKGKYYFCGQNPRPADFYAGFFPTFHFSYYCVLFLNHSSYFLSANNEQWLRHTVGNYLSKEVKVNAELIFLYFDWICPLNWTLVVERRNVSVAGAILLCTDHPKTLFRWVRSMVLPGLWRPNRTFYDPLGGMEPRGSVEGSIPWRELGSKDCTNGMVHWVKLERHKMQSQDPLKGRKWGSEESTLDILVVLRKSWAFGLKFRHLKKKGVLITVI